MKEIGGTTVIKNDIRIRTGGKRQWARPKKNQEEVKGEMEAATEASPPEGARIKSSTK